MDGLLSFLTPEQQAMAERQARQAMLTQLGFGLLQASTGAPGQRRPSLGQIVGQAGPGAMQAYQGGFDRTLQQIMLSQQMAEQQRQREAQARVAQRLTPEQQEQVAAFGTDVLRKYAIPEEETYTLSPGQKRFKGTTEVAAAPPEVSQSQAYQDYLLARQDPVRPFTGSFVDYQTMLKQAGRTQVTATATAGGKPDTFMEEVKKSTAKDFVEVVKSGRSAQGASVDINRLDNLLSRVQTGGAAAFKQAAGNFGIKTERLGDIQAAQAIINKLVPTQRPPGSGTMSDADLELYKQSLPRIINQPGANREIIRSMREINQYLIKEGQIAAEVTAGKITPEEGTKRIMELGNPVQDFFARTQQPAVPPGVRVRRVN